MGVTSIKALHNLGTTPVSLRNLENTAESIEGIAPASSRYFAMWIPWLWIPSWFPGKHLELVFASGKTAYIWQEGDFVRYSWQGQFQQGATPVPGFSGVDGDRTLIVSAGETFVFAPGIAPVPTGGLVPDGVVPDGVVPDGTQLVPLVQVPGWLANLIPGLALLTALLALARQR